MTLVGSLTLPLLFCRSLFRIFNPMFMGLLCTWESGVGSLYAFFLTVSRWTLPLVFAVSVDSLLSFVFLVLLRFGAVAGEPDSHVQLYSTLTVCFHCG